MNIKICLIFLVFSVPTYSQSDSSLIKEHTNYKIYYYDISRIYMLNKLALSYAVVDTNAAFRCIDEALYLSDKFNWSKGKAISHYNRGLIELKNNCYLEALFSFRTAYNQYVKLEDTDGVIASAHYLGKVYYNVKQTDQAIKSFNLSLDLSFKNRNIIFIKENYIALADIKYHEDDFKKAYEYLKTYELIIDSLYGFELEERINKLKMVYLADEREDKIKQLTNENYFKENLLKRNTSLLLLLIGILILMFVLAYIIYLIYITKEENKKLLIDEEISQAVIEKEKKFSDIVRLLPQIIFETNKTGYFTYLNKYALKKIAYSENEIYLMSLNDILFQINNKSIDISHADIVETLNEKEFLLKTKNNNFIPIIVYIDKVNIYEKFYGYRGIMFDISDRKTLEENVLKAIIKTEERERSRFSLELHDTLGPLLSTLKLYVNEIQTDKTDNNIKNNLFKEIYTLLDDAVAYSREISHNMTPGVLKDYGLIKSLNIYIQKINSLKKVEITFKSKTDKDRYDDFFEINIYRIVSELILNSINHGKASNIVIDIGENDGQFKLNYYDNGSGFNLSSPLTDGSGLINISSRVKAIKGTSYFNTSEGEGFSFFLNCPLIHIY